MDTARALELEALIQPFHVARYSVDIGFAYLERWLENTDKDWGRDGKPGLNLDPDFQRSHVWSADQRSRYIEYILRGGTASTEVQFNHPWWETPQATPDLPYEMQIVDGKQRVETVRRFMRGEVRAFGLLAKDFDGTRFAPGRTNFRLRVNVHALTSRAELLRFYLSLNSGGVVHSAEELARVRALLAETEAGKAA